MSHAALMDALKPVLDALHGLKIADAAAAAAHLNEIMPVGSPAMKQLRDLFDRGAREGWLVDKQGGPTVRFSRAAKASDDTRGFSIDAVRMSGPGVWHRHIAGEIDLCFARNAGAQFDGHPEGWVVFAPGSDHVPTVTGGEMDIFYFLPGGQIEWKR